MFLFGTEICVPFRGNAFQWFKQQRLSNNNMQVLGLWRSWTFSCDWSKTGVSFAVAMKARLVIQNRSFGGVVVSTHHQSYRW